MCRRLSIILLQIFVTQRDHVYWWRGFSVQHWPQILVRTSIFLQYKTLRIIDCEQSFFSSKVRGARKNPKQVSVRAWLWAWRASGDAILRAASSVGVVTNTVSLPRLFCVFPTVFEENRDCSQSSSFQDLSSPFAFLIIKIGEGDVMGGDKVLSIISF